MTRWWLGAIILLLSGCMVWPFARSGALLDRADHLAARGDYVAAVRVYDEFLATHPDDPAAERALASRDTAAGILTARDEIARLREKLENRDGEAGRLRQEIERLRAESDRLRGDLEKLKRLELELERRRR